MEKFHIWRAWGWVESRKDCVKGVLFFLPIYDHSLSRFHLRRNIRLAHKLGLSIIEGGGTAFLSYEFYPKSHLASAHTVLPAHLPSLLASGIVRMMYKHRVSSIISRFLCLHRLLMTKWPTSLELSSVFTSCDGTYFCVPNRLFA